jgi:hypothetical protein
LWTATSCLYVGRESARPQRRERLDEARVVSQRELLVEDG